jgi:hypothetical protein
VLACHDSTARALAGPSVDQATRSSCQPTLPATASTRASHDEADGLGRPTSKDRCDRSTPLPGGADSATERPRRRALPMRVGALTPTVRTFSQVTSSMRISRSGWAPVTTMDK